MMNEARLQRSHDLDEGVYRERVLRLARIQWGEGLLDHDRREITQRQQARPCRKREDVAGEDQLSTMVLRQTTVDVHIHRRAPECPPRMRLVATDLTCKGPC